MSFELILSIVEKGLVFAIAVYLIVIGKNNLDRIERERKKHNDKQKEIIIDVKVDLEKLIGLFNSLNITLASLEEENINQGKDNEVIREKLKEIDRDVSGINTAIAMIRTKLGV